MPKEEEVKPPVEPINPYIPMFISSVPWYVAGGAGADGAGNSGDHLMHQRTSGIAIKTDNGNEKKTSADIASSKTAVVIPAPKRFIKGACENCGGLGHKTKECVERPRKAAAKYTGKNLRSDEIVNDKVNSYDSKRDHWSSYDPKQHDKVVKEWEEAEEARQRLKEKQIEEELKKKKEESKGSSSLLDVLSDSESDDVPDNLDGTIEDGSANKQKQTTSTAGQKNLRIREDTAKYLRSLRVDDGYNPKSRSMNANLVSDKDPSKVLYVADTVVSATGETSKMLNAQVYAWDAERKGNSINLQADPTLAEIMYKKSKKENETQVKELEKSLLEKYGGEEHLVKNETIDELPAQTEVYVEYNTAGQVVSNEIPVLKRREYEEDEYEKYAPGHASVWGSWFDREKMRWGYACCHSLFKSAYCTGNEGLEVTNEKLPAALNRDGEKSLQEIHLEKMQQERVMKKQRLE